MSTEMIVALLASGTSLVVAIVGLVAAVITNRQAARSEMSIESLKFEISHKKAKEAMRNAEIEQALEALHLAIQSIQHLKDEVQLILSAVDSSLDTATAIDRVDKARQALFICHEQQMTRLNKDEEDAFHKAKNLSLTVEQLLREGLSGQENASALAEDRRERLTNLRNEFTELQNVLRDSRSLRLLKRFGDA